MEQLYYGHVGGSQQATQRVAVPPEQLGALGELSAQIERLPKIQAEVNDLALRLIGPRPEGATGGSGASLTRHGGILGACEQTAREVQARLDDIENALQAIGSALR
jgi:hypothetical protein